MVNRIGFVLYKGRNEDFSKWSKFVRFCSMWRARIHRYHLTFNVDLERASVPQKPDIMAAVRKSLNAG